MPPPSQRPPDAPPPFRPKRPIVIGVTGGIAAGKSAVGRLFAAHGLISVDADAVARAVAEEPDVVRAVAAEFGPTAVRDGHFDRPALAKIVFADADARARLEAILHPRIRARILEALREHASAGRSVLLDAPLLLETGLVEFCDSTVYIETSAAVRQQRAASRGWDAEELERREAAQIPLAVKKQRAAHIIGNDGDLNSTARDVAAALETIASLL